MSNGTDLATEGTSIQRLDRIERKVDEVSVKADAAVTTANAASTQARDAAVAAGEVNRASAESFRQATKALTEMSTVLFGSTLVPDGGAIGRINKKLDSIATDAKATATLISDRKESRDLQVRGYAIYGILLIVAGVIGFVISHVKF